MKPSKKLLLLTLKNVCRLCGSKLDLVSVFDKKFNAHRTMKDIVKLTTTVEILEEDKISHKICSKCIASAIKLFQFRDQCIIQNEILKKQYAEIFKDEKQPDTSQPTKSEDSPAPVTSNKITGPIKSEDSPKPITSNKIIKTVKTEDSPKSFTSTTTQPIKSENVPKPQITPEPKQFRVHSSIKKLFKNYPQLRLPTTVLNLNINPHAVMELDSVENYFKHRKLDMKKYIQMTLKNPPRVAFKSTSKPTKMTSHLKNSERANRISNNPKLAEELIPKRGRKRQRSSSGSISSNSKKTNISPSLRNKSPKVFLPLKIDTSPSSSPSNLQKIDQSPSSSSSISSNSKICLSLDFDPSPSSSPVPSTFSDDMSDVCDISTKSRDLHVCNICSSVHYSARDLTRHQSKHLRCQFCKIKFKTLEIKTKHVESQCKIQKAMNGMINLPEINLKKVELNLEIRKKYRDVFEIFPPIPGLEQNGLLENTAKIIEIVSDDDISKKSITETKMLLKPKIEIKDGILNNLLETSNSNDLKLLKNLLSSYNKVHKKVNDSTQTKLPTNELIKIHHGEFTAEMKCLKQHLSYYKIPIEIKHSLTPHTCYKYDCGKTVKKEIKYWNQHAPLDIKSEPGYGEDYSSIDFFNDQLIAPIKEENLLIEDIYNKSIPILNAIESENVLIKEDNVDLVDMELEENFEEHRIPNILNTSNEKILLKQDLNEKHPKQNLEELCTPNIDVEMISDEQNLTVQEAVSENELSRNLEKSNQNNLIQINDQISNKCDNIESDFKDVINDIDASLTENKKESSQNLNETSNNLTEVNDQESNTCDNNKSCSKEINDDEDVSTLSENDGQQELKECRIPNIQDNVTENLSEYQISNLSDNIESSSDEIVNKEILSEEFINGNDLDEEHKSKENSLHNGINNDVQTLQSSIVTNDKNICNEGTELTREINKFYDVLNKLDNIANKNDNDFQEDDAFVETSGSKCTRTENENGTLNYNETLTEKVNDETLCDKNKDVSLSSANTSTLNLDYVGNQSTNDTSSLQYFNSNKIKLNLLKDLKNSNNLKVINDTINSTNALHNLGEEYCMSSDSTKDVPILRVKTLHELNK